MENKEYFKLVGSEDEEDLSMIFDEPFTPTEIMQEFMALDKEYKELKKRHESLRKSVIEEFDKNPGKTYKGITKSVSQRIDFKHLEFYNWVSETFPEYLEELKDRRIDYDKFESLEARGEIEYDELPEHLYKMTEITRITVKKR